MPSGRLAHKGIEEGNHRHSVEAGVLDVDPRGSVAEDDEGEGLVEPTIRAVAVEELIACVEGVCRDTVFETDTEERGLYEIERARVSGITVEESLSAPRPLGPR